jgi:hypothetical protein
MNNDSTVANQRLSRPLSALREGQRGEGRDTLAEKVPDIRTAFVLGAEWATMAYLHTGPPHLYEHASAEACRRFAAPPPQATHPDTARLDFYDANPNAVGWSTGYLGSRGAWTWTDKQNAHEVKTVSNLREALDAAMSRPSDTGDTMTSKNVGLIGKYHVERTDGSSAEGQKHHGCQYFVLDLTHDPLAFPALAAYERHARQAGYVALADDLLPHIAHLSTLVDGVPAGEATRPTTTQSGVTAADIEWAIERASDGLHNSQLWREEGQWDAYIQPVLDRMSAPHVLPTRAEVEAAIDRYGDARRSLEKCTDIAPAASWALAVKDARAALLSLIPTRDATND